MTSPAFIESVRTLALFGFVFAVCALAAIVLFVALLWIWGRREEGVGGVKAGKTVWDEYVDWAPTDDPGGLSFPMFATALMPDDAIAVVGRNDTVVARNVGRTLHPYDWSKREPMIWGRAGG